MYMFGIRKRSGGVGIKGVCVCVFAYVQGRFNDPRRGVDEVEVEVNSRWNVAMSCNDRVEQGLSRGKKLKKGEEWRTRERVCV